MKKSYMLAIALIASSTVFAQDSNDSLTFESFDLGANAFYNGSDEVGSIVINDITLSNTYTPAWSSWNGFAISQVQDNTTAGFGNQYASFANGGDDNSNKYAVFYLDGMIEFNQYRVVTSLSVTNTTYAALTMRDGDSFTKAFGSPLGIDGTPDGTEGKDWLKLQIIALDENDAVLGDTVSFYLADYRFENDEDDYIVSTWEKIALESFVAKKIKFVMTSSDNGAFGMNTPAYFALDNVISSPTVGIIETKQLAVTLAPNPASDIVTIVMEETGQLELFNAMGQLVHTQEVSNKSKLNVANFPAGIYHLTVQSDRGTAAHKLVIQ